MKQPTKDKFHETSLYLFNLFKLDTSVYLSQDMKLLNNIYLFQWIIKEVKNF